MARPISNMIYDDSINRWQKELPLDGNWYVESVSFVDGLADELLDKSDSSKGPVSVSIRDKCTGYCMKFRVSLALGKVLAEHLGTGDPTGA